MKKRFLGIFALLAVLCIALVGCGGAANKENFIGEWQMVAMEGEDPVPEEDLQTMKDLGMTVDLSIAEDGTCTLVMFGEDYGSGEWKATSATTCEMTIDDQAIDVTYDAETGRLRFAQGESALIFERLT